MKSCYGVVVKSVNSWNTDGTPIIIARCDHRHRTEETAERCRKYLTRTYPDGMVSAKWHHAYVRKVTA